MHKINHLSDTFTGKESRVACDVEQAKQAHVPCPPEEAGHGTSSLPVIAAPQAHSRGGAAYHDLNACHFAWASKIILTHVY